MQQVPPSSSLHPGVNEGSIVRAKLCLLAALCGATGTAGAFELALSEPELSLSVPGVPAITLREQTPSPESSRRLLAGRDAVYTVEVELSRQASEVSPRTCAELLLRALLSQPGMPHRDSIYRAPLNISTFLIIYTAGEGPQEKLHAHILSSAGANHCANAHFIRQARAGEDADEWRTTFTSARVLPSNR